MDYTHVQFISWELYTGPDNAPPPAPPGSQRYLGIRNRPDNRLDVPSQISDIEARVKFTELAIDLAARGANIDARPTTLKVFMGPEFLYRGAGGAYLHDLINGWAGPAPADFLLAPPYNNNWPGLFGSLQTLVANEAYKDWVFVFGTAISASFSTILVPSPRTPESVAVINDAEPAEVYNSALIQLGGATNGAIKYASRKQYKSHIDFIRDYHSAIQQAFLDNNTTPLDPRTLAVVNEGAQEGGALFNLASVNYHGRPLNFGLEVCLDHAVSGGWNNATHRFNNEFGRIRAANQYVKLQLVPSGGMSLHGDSIRLEPGTPLTPTSYAFNCDGLGNLNRTYGCHTQIWNGANGAAVPPANRLYEASSGEALAHTVSRALPPQAVVGHANVQATALWTQGAGHVRLIDPLAL